MDTSTRKTGAERRDEIIAAAIRLIGEEGFSAFTTNRLASEVGLSSGAIFRHFKNREDILRGLVSYACNQLSQCFPGEPYGPVDRVLRLAKARVALLRAQPGITWLLKSDQAVKVLPTDAVDELQALAAQSRKYLLGALRDGIEEGLIRSDVPVEHLLLIVMGSIHSLFSVPNAKKTKQPESIQNTKAVAAPDPDAILSTLVKLISTEDGET